MLRALIYLFVLLVQYKYLYRVCTGRGSILVPYEYRTTRALQFAYKYRTRTRTQYRYAVSQIGDGDDESSPRLSELYYAFY